jgi:type I restriction modification DNA specificity domain protein
VEKEKLIELLKEQKQILINDAITKGINKNAKFKNSGVEWLGEIPSHWEKISIKRLITLLTDYTANGSFADLAKNVQYLDEPNYAQLIRLTDIRNDFKEKGVYISKKSYEYLSKSSLFGGELLMANVGAYSGYSFLLPEKLNFKASLAPNMFLIKFNQKQIDNKFVFYALNCHVILNRLVLIATSTAQPKLNKDNVRSIFLPLPPKDEQEKIVEYIETKTAKIDKLLNLEQECIKSLKEYKASLIDSVVTGKVRII